MKYLDISASEKKNRLGLAADEDEKHIQYRMKYVMLFDIVFLFYLHCCITQYWQK